MFHGCHLLSSVDCTKPPEELLWSDLVWLPLSVALIPVDLIDSSQATRLRLRRRAGIGTSCPFAAARNVLSKRSRSSTPNASPSDAVLFRRSQAAESPRKGDLETK